MQVHEISEVPTEGMARALAVYESKFVYSLAGERRFRIDYGPDRTAFIRSLGGEWRLFAAERAGEIVGTAEMGTRQLETPDGTRREVVFVTEVRVLPGARRGIATARLLQRTAQWRRTEAAGRYSVVNDNNPVKPPEYTGRLGIPRQCPLGKVSLIRIPLAPGPAGTEAMRAGDGEGLAAYGRLAAGYCRFAPAPGAERSSFAPRWLIHPRGTACARLEDRRKAVRLVEVGGGELLAAFLSYFAFSDAADGRELMAEACATAAGMGYIALRSCFSPGQLAALRAAGGPPIPAAGAEVYGTVEEGEMAGGEWLINGPEM